MVSSFVLFLPCSVLVQKEKYLKITDFGTCRVMDNQSTVMTVVGSCAWMAPELIRNEPCNGRVDVWSYGILLWELLTQEVPYKVKYYQVIASLTFLLRLIFKKCNSVVFMLRN